jgi:hypothetical protein
MWVPNEPFSILLKGHIPTAKKKNTTEEETK